jgi:hypothetical protein
MTCLPVGMGILEALRPADVLRRRVDVRRLVHRDLYADVLERHAGLACGFLQALLDKPTPALVHCTAGKDRTGMLVALLYLALGVPRDRIVESYLAIGPHLQQHFPYTLRALVQLFDGPPLAYSVIADYIERMLDRIERYDGGVNGYLHAIGFEALGSLRARFLE